MKNKKTTTITITFVVLILALVAYYTYLVNRDRPASTKNITLVEQVLLRNLENDYPPTPKEVIKFYNDILKCLYNEEYTKEEFEELAMQARRLFDTELLIENVWDSYIDALNIELVEFKEKARRITSFSVASSTDVEYFQQDGFSFAKIRSGYNIIENKTNNSVIQYYLLRKDEDGRWKIYGWDLEENILNNE